MTAPRLLLALLLCAATPAPAALVTLAASKDNSLYFDLSGTKSNGKGPTIFTGNSASNAIHRGLIAFDLSAIPPGASIQSVSLLLFLPQAQNFATGVSLYRLTTDWGEGSSNAGMRGGGGATATTGDATWTQSIRPGSLWTTPGGDFVSTPSATTLVANEGLSYTWNSTPQLIADLQGWLSDPASNFGWIIRGDETQGATAKAFASREYFDSALRPKLIVTYAAVPEPAFAALCPLALAVALIARKRLVRRYRPAKTPPSA